ncbi:MAG: hypothetical protein JF628_07075 [Sphingomonas sp.]|nr:hypothetical protein [Sphingomonas sp.]
MPDFEFDLDAPQGLLTVRLLGFWNVETVARYGQELAAHLQKLAQLRPPRACLVDARSFAIQTKEVAERQVQIVGSLLPLYPERTARVVGSAIARQQASRMATNSSHRVFDSIDDALQWLREK